MSRILLTNDDGIAAPGLVAFARSLAEIADVAVVVPDRERSWVGKAITRYDPVTVTAVDKEGIHIHACSGYPADCVQLGIHTLFPDPPDLVVSGINVGYNHGMAYLQSSGTAGAALEAGISRIPAIAFSAGSLRVPWDEWKVSVLEAEARPMWERLANLAADLCRSALAACTPGDILNIGLPDTADITTGRRVTRVAPVGYDRLFAETAPGIYSHAYGGLVFDGEDLTGTDVAAARAEVVSITPIRGVGNADSGVSEALLAALTGSPR